MRFSQNYSAIRESRHDRTGPPPQDRQSVPTLPPAQALLAAKSPREVRHGSIAALLGPDVGALFGDRAFHEEDQAHERKGQDRGQPEDVKVGQRGGLLLSNIGKHL